MAKLNVVIPAVEVTVEVNGKAAKYRKVDRKAQAGDIVRALVHDSDIDKGAFYAVYADSNGDLVFADNAGDERPYQLRHNSTMYEVYAPVTEQATVLSASTITFQGAEWRKVDRAAREGDAIKFTDEFRSSYLRDAELYIVTDTDADDDTVFVTDDDGDEIDVDGRGYEVYEKVTEVGVDYREVKRKANVGERIKIVAAEQNVGYYENGEEHVVINADRWDDGLAVTVRGVDYAIYHREYVVLEPIAAPKPKRLRVGEYARVVEYGHHAFSYGDIVKIIEDDGSCVPYFAESLSTGKMDGRKLVGSSAQQTKRLRPLKTRVVNSQSAIRCD